MLHHIIREYLNVHPHKGIKNIQQISMNMH